MGADPRIYRTAGTVRAAIGATAAVPVLLLLGATTGGANVVWFIFAPLVAVLAWRCWKLGIRTARDGVQIVGFFASRRVSWIQVERFAVEPLGSYPFVAHVVLRNGDHLPCLGLSSAARPNPDKKRLLVQEPVDKLNQLLASNGTPAA